MIPRRYYCKRLSVLTFACIFPISFEAEHVLAASVEPTPTVRVYGAEASDGTGDALASGDVNGDGFVDIIMTISQPGDIEVDILWGGSGLNGVIDLAGLEVGITRILGGPTDNATLARVACADFDADGCDDIALGLPITNDGTAYIVFGSPSLADTIALSSPTERVTRINGVNLEGSALGWEVAAGDVNNDNFDDLIVSAPDFHWSGGEVYIIYGRAAFPALMDMSVAMPGMTRVIEPELLRGAGMSLACRDVDADGYADVLIGAPGNSMNPPQNIGMATLLYGAADLPDTVLLSESTFEMKKFYGVNDYDWLGQAVAIADLNADRLPEIVMSATGSDPFGCGSCGEIYVVWGGQPLPDSTHVGNPTVAMTRLLGAGLDTRYGSSLAVGDVNGDGWDDIAIGSHPDYYDQADVGKVTVVEGQWELPDTVFLASNPSLTRLRGQTHGDDFGKGLSLADYNGDGNADVVVSANRASPLGRLYAGQVFMFLGADTVISSATRSSSPARLEQNYPNPFNPTTTIAYSITTESRVLLRVFDVHGALLTTLVNEQQPPGGYRVIWDGVNDSRNSVASGIYFYSLLTGQFVHTKKMVLLK